MISITHVDNGAYSAFNSKADGHAFLEEDPNSRQSVNMPQVIPIKY